MTLGLRLASHETNYNVLVTFIIKCLLSIHQKKILPWIQSLLHCFHPLWCSLLILANIYSRPLEILPGTIPPSYHTSTRLRKRWDLPNRTHQILLRTTLQWLKGLIREQKNVLPSSNGLFPSSIYIIFRANTRMVLYIMFAKLLKMARKESRNFVSHN